MKKILIIGLALGMVISAQGFGGRQAKDCKMGGKQLHAELNLTTEQSDKIEALKLDFQKQQIDQRADVQKLHLEMKELMRADKPNRKAINSTLEKISGKQLVMKKMHVNHRLDVRELLTDEQKEIFDQHAMRKGHGRQGNGMGSRHGGHGFRGFQGPGDCIME